jgi:hypothetical protein
MTRLIMLILLLTAAVASPAWGRDLLWQSLDSLQGGDRSLAEQTLSDMWGDDPQLWPDWIDPAALYVPVARNRLLIVRRPLHAPCGQYGFAIFGPVTADLRRDRIGDFCAGSIGVIAVTSRDWPDLMILEGRLPDAEGVWQRLDQRVRWHDGQWWRILAPE